MAKTLLEILKELNVEVDAFLDGLSQDSIRLINEFIQHNNRHNREELLNHLKENTQSTLYKVLATGIHGSVTTPPKEITQNEIKSFDATTIIVQIGNSAMLKQVLDEHPEFTKDLTPISSEIIKVLESKNVSDQEEFLKKLLDDKNEQYKKLKNLLQTTLGSADLENFNNIKICLEYLKIRFTKNQPTPTPDAKEKETPSEDQEKKDRPEPTPSQTPSSGTVSSPITPDQFKKAAADTFKELYTGKFSDDAKDFNFTNNDNQACTNIGDCPGTLTRKDSTDQSGKQLTQITAEGFGDADANLRAAISTIVNIAKQLHSSANNSRIQYTCALSYDDSSLSLDQAKLDAILKDLNYDQTKEPVQFYPAGTKKPAVNAHLDEQEEPEEEKKRKKDEQEHEQLKNQIMENDQFAAFLDRAGDITQHILNGDDGDWGMLIDLCIRQIDDRCDHDPNNHAERFLKEIITQLENANDQKQKDAATNFLKTICDSHSHQYSSWLSTLLQQINDPTLKTDLLCHLLKNKRYDLFQAIKLDNLPFRSLMTCIKTFLTVENNTSNEETTNILRALLEKALEDKNFAWSKELITQLVENPNFVKLITNEDEPLQIPIGHEIFLSLINLALEKKQDEKLVLALLKRINWRNQLNTVKAVSPLLQKACQCGYADTVKKIIEKYIPADYKQDFRKNLKSFFQMIEWIHYDLKDNIQNTLKAILDGAATCLPTEEKTEFLGSLALPFAVSLEGYSQLFYKDPKNANIIFFGSNGFLEDLIGRDTGTLTENEINIISCAIRNLKEAGRKQSLDAASFTLEGDIDITLNKIGELSNIFAKNPKTEKFSTELKEAFPGIMRKNFDADVARQKSKREQKIDEENQTASASPQPEQKSTDSKTSTTRQDAAIRFLHFVENDLSASNFPEKEKQALALKVVKHVTEFIRDNPWLSKKITNAFLHFSQEHYEEINSDKFTLGHTRIYIGMIQNCASIEIWNPWGKGKDRKVNALNNFKRILDDLNEEVNAAIQQAANQQQHVASSSNP